jgi:hypothetical protein
MTVYQENCYGKPWEREILTNQLYKLLGIDSNNKCRIKRSSLSDGFFNTKDLLQGCPLSPTLLKICIDTALKE